MQIVHIIAAILLLAAPPAFAAQVGGAVRDRNPPSAVSDSNSVIFRAGKFSELFIHPVIGKGAYGVANDGLYFRATNPTISTGVTMSATGTQTWVATTPTFIWRNTDSAGGKRIYLDYCRILWTAVGAATTSVQAAVIIDTGNRFNSGGTAITPVNANMDSSTATVTNFYVFPSATTANTPRIVSRFALSTSIPIVGETYNIDFAPDNYGVKAQGASGDKIGVTGPVIVGGGHSALLYIWFPASTTTAHAGELDCGWWER